MNEDQDIFGVNVGGIIDFVGGAIDTVGDIISTVGQVSGEIEKIIQSDTGALGQQSSGGSSQAIPQIVPFIPNGPLFLFGLIAVVVFFASK